MTKNAVFYVGNIMQRTLSETSCNASAMTVKSQMGCFTLKEKAILYQTKNGVFVDSESLSPCNTSEIITKKPLSKRYRFHSF